MNTRDLNDILWRLGPAAPEHDPEEKGEWLAPGDPRRATLAREFNSRACEAGVLGDSNSEDTADSAVEALTGDQWVWVHAFGVDVWWDFLPDAERAEAQREAAEAAEREAAARG